MEVIECYIPLEKGFFDLLTTLRADYDPWLRQMRSRNFSSVSIAGTLSGTLWEVSVIVPRLIWNLDIKPRT